MFSLKNKFNKYKIWFLWLTSILFGWGIVGYFGFENRNLLLSSQSIVFQTLSNLFLNGSMIGGVIGILQFLFLSKSLNLSKSWIWLQAFIYALGSTLGILIVIALAWISIPNLFTQPQIIFPIPLSLMMFIGGSIIGLMQVLILSRQIKIKFLEGMLYVLLSSLAWGLSFFLSSILGSKILYVENVIAGATIGAITGLALLILIQAKEQINISQTKI